VAEELVGYACLYWHFTSLVPAETVLMNDSTSTNRPRGEGVGRALIEGLRPVAASVAPTTSMGHRPGQRDRPAPL